MHETDLIMSEAPRRLTPPTLEMLLRSESTRFSIQNCPFLFSRIYSMKKLAIKKYTNDSIHILMNEK